MIKADINSLKNQIVLGKNINLRVANELDAEFILQLRLDPNLNKFIGKTDPDIENQKNWIKSSFENENDFHFIIEDKNGNPYGTIALYNIDYEKGQAEWGRWIIKPNSEPFFSIESNGLAFYVAFRKLGLNKLIGGANIENKKVVNFHKMYVTVSSIDEQHIWFYVNESNYLKYMKIFKNFHNFKP